jgi:hypothetical protein
MEIEPSKSYIRGVNNGYIMAKYEPKILDSIISANSDKDEWVKGMTDGKKLYLKELMQEKLEEMEKSKKKGFER